MTGHDMRPLDEAVVPVVTEADLAEHLRRGGRRVVVHRGRYWKQVTRGFFSPVHVRARLSAREATRPALACWGFRAALTDEDADRANAAIPLHLASDLDLFQEELLPASRRRKLRRARRLVQLVELTGPALLREQGYDVYLSSLRRTGSQALQSRTGSHAMPSMEAYLAGLGHFGDPAQGIVLAGIIDGRLGGYLTGNAVDGTAYVHDVVVSTDALRTDISTGLTYEFIYACRRSPRVTELVHGLHVPEDEGLCRYKEWLALALERVPARVRLAPGAASVIHKRSPGSYYRLTGRE
jgi:hypothetical protein